MTSVPASIKAHMYYDGDPQAAFAQLTHRLIDAFAKSGVTIRPRLVTSTDLAFMVGGLTLSCTFAGHALDVAARVRAGRPQAATVSLGGILDKLHRHRRAVVISVCGPQHLAKTDTRLALCYIATRHLMTLAPPELIYWAPSDTLYDLVEFCGVTGTRLPDTVRSDRAAGPVPVPERSAQFAPGGTTFPADRSATRFMANDPRAIKPPHRSPGKHIRTRRATPFSREHPDWPGGRHNLHEDHQRKSRALTAQCRLTDVDRY